jgi:hypothetical protein
MKKHLVKSNVEVVVLYFVLWSGLLFPFAGSIATLAQTPDKTSQYKELIKKGDAYLLSRRNNPANGYSDGTYTFTFDGNDNLKGVSFVNVANTENWHRSIELNKDGNVSCYIDKTNDVIRQSLCMIYHPEPQAKYPVETVTTIFEKDGISYYQKNNTTGKIRTRDKMTLEWSQWKP